MSTTPSSRRSVATRVVGARVVDERQPQARRRRRGHRLDDLRHDVLGGHEVDVVAARGLQSSIMAAISAGESSSPDPRLRDVPVLAEDAAQVALAEEDRSRAPEAGEHRLLSGVGERAGDEGVSTRAADSGLALVPQGLASARARRATIERLPRLSDAGFQLVFGGERKVAGSEVADDELALRPSVPHARSTSVPQVTTRP